MRVSVESPLYTHRSEGSENIGDATELEPDVMVSYVLEEQRMSFDLELGEAFLLRTKDVAVDAPSRLGTFIRPGVAYAPSPTLPIFVTAMLPIKLEPSPALLELRLGAGVNIAKTSIGKWFVEADVDLPLVGGSTAPSAFSAQQLVLATGLLFHLPG
ncbi:MAG: hypothetical protein JO257_26615 [Deltaproteobacteria bacterium]|nr:hypothetical protein [Deltaproteobacteria bacterium]